MTSGDNEANLHQSQVINTMKALEEAQEEPFELENLPKVGQLSGC
jgi:hypothetical protein